MAYIYDCLVIYMSMGLSPTIKNNLNNMSLGLSLGNVDNDDDTNVFILMSWIWDYV